jgi:hypothetical protein
MHSKGLLIYDPLQIITHISGVDNYQAYSWHCLPQCLVSFEILGPVGTVRILGGWDYLSLQVQDVNVVEPGLLQPW